MINDIIKIEGRFSYTLFPKLPKILGTEENKFGIVCWNVTSVLDGVLDKDERESIVITGNYEQEVARNKVYTIMAKEIKHEKYGKQFQLIFIGEILNLTGVVNQKGFLRTFLNENQIIEMFKVLDDPLKSISDHDLEALKKVKGVQDYVGQRIIDRYEEGKDYCEVYLKLDGLGLTPNFIQKLVRVYGSPQKIIEIVTENPYQLSFDIDGIGFKTTDKIAMSNGIDPKSEKRVIGYINYILDELGESGNSYTTAGQLAAYIFDEFDGRENILEVYYDGDGKVDGTNISRALEYMEAKGKVILEDAEPKNQRRVYLTKYWLLENEIAEHLKRLSNAPNSFKYNNWEDVLLSQENKQRWTFTDEQRQGIKLGLDNQVCLVTGGAGTGKSSLVSGILAALKDYNFAQTALSGKASARLQEVTGQKGSTIHRLLGFNPQEGFTYNEYNQLPNDIIILDEISLVGGQIFLSLLKAIPTGAKLFVLGDMGQLESIGCMNLAHDLYESEHIATVELSKIHRQAQKSGIIVASKQIRSGESIFDKSFVGDLTLGELKDMHFKIFSDTGQTRKIAIEEFKRYWKSDLVSDIMDIQILSPVKNRGDACVAKLNDDVQNFVNPSITGKNEREIVYKDILYTLREDDKVMVVKNNYRLLNKYGKETFVFNGWTGTVQSIDNHSETVRIYFSIIDDTIMFPFELLPSSVVLGYASTVHKYQGSSAKVIIGVFDYSTPPSMLTRELLYTLLTRAEKECTLVCQNRAVSKAINASGVTGKNTFLCELL